MSKYNQSKVYPAMENTSLENNLTDSRSCPKLLELEYGEDCHYAAREEDNCNSDSIPYGEIPT